MEGYEILTKEYGQNSDYNDDEEYKPVLVIVQDAAEQRSPAQLTVTTWRWKKMHFLQNCTVPFDHYTSEC